MSASPSIGSSRRNPRRENAREGRARALRDLRSVGHVKKVRAPLMVLHGANDAFVAVFEADQVISAIRAQGERWSICAFRMRVT